MARTRYELHLDWITKFVSVNPAPEFLIASPAVHPTQCESYVTLFLLRPS
jgi:hypothetical protein